MVELPALPTGDGPSSAMVAFCHRVLHAFAASTGRNPGHEIAAIVDHSDALDGRRAAKRQFVGAFAVGAR